MCTFSDLGQFIHDKPCSINLNQFFLKGFPCQRVRQKNGESLLCRIQLQLYVVCHSENQHIHLPIVDDFKLQDDAILHSQQQYRVANCLQCFLQSPFDNLSLNMVVVYRSFTRSVYFNVLSQVSYHFYQVVCLSWQLLENGNVGITDV